MATAFFAVQLREKVVDAWWAFHAQRVRMRCAIAAIRAHGLWNGIDCALMTRAVRAYRHRGLQLSVIQFGYHRRAGRRRGEANDQARGWYTERYLGMPFHAWRRLTHDWLIERRSHILAAAAGSPSRLSLATLARESRMAREESLLHWRAMAAAQRRERVSLDAGTVLESLELTRDFLAGMALRRLGHSLKRSMLRRHLLDWRRHLCLAVTAECEGMQGTLLTLEDVLIELETKRGEAATAAEEREHASHAAASALHVRCEALEGLLADERVKIQETEAGASLWAEEASRLQQQEQRLLEECWASTQEISRAQEEAEAEATAVRAMQVLNAI